MPRSAKRRREKRREDAANGKRPPLRNWNPRSDKTKRAREDADNKTKAGMRRQMTALQDERDNLLKELESERKDHKSQLEAMCQQKDAEKEELRQQAVEYTETVVARYEWLKQRCQIKGVEPEAVDAYIDSKLWHAST